MANPLLAAATRVGGGARRRVSSYYSGADHGRLNQDWLLSQLSADQVLRSDMTTLRTRARELVMNNSSASRIPQLFSENVIGKDGILLQAKVRHGRGPKATPNREASLAIEEWWYDWCEAASASVDGRLNWLDIETLITENEVTDGEVLIRLVDGFPNRFGFALELLDPDQLDATFHREATHDQAQVRMGIEQDGWGRPLAYHLWSNHPSEPRRRQRVRVPAADIIHLYVMRRTQQSRGVTWFAPVVFDLKMLGGYREAHVVAARTGASKMGFFKKTLEAGGELLDPQAESTPLSMEVSPGLMEELPAGLDFVPWDPKFPDANFDGFDKAMLRAIGTATRVSYMSVSGDLGGTSYGSGRIGMLAERAVYQKLQQRQIEHVHRRVYRRALRMAITSGALDLDPFQMADYLRADSWRPRTFPWIDPRADMESAEKEIALGINSLTALAAERGRDLEEVFQERQAELALAKQYGVPLQLGDGTMADGEPEDPEERDARDADGKPPVPRSRPAPRPSRGR